MQLLKFFLFKRKKTFNKSKTVDFKFDEFIVSLFLSGYVIYQYLLTGLEFLLLMVVFYSLFRCYSIYKFRFFRLKSVVYSFGYILIGVSFGAFNGNFLLSIKILIFVATSLSVVYARLFSPRLFLCSFLLHVIIYFFFFHDAFAKYDNLSFFEYAPNYFVFSLVPMLFAAQLNPILVFIFSLASFSRWNVVSVLGGASKVLAIVLLVGGFANLTVAKVDTTLGVKESSDGDRLKMLHFQLETWEEYFFGKSVESIRDDIHFRVNFTTDSFEGIVFDVYSLFGVFGFWILFWHLRLFFYTKKENGYIKYASLYVFLYAFFNPVVYSFCYYLYVEYLIFNSRVLKK